MILVIAGVVPPKRDGRIQRRRLVGSTKGLIAGAVTIAAALSGALIALLLLDSSVSFNDWPAPPSGRDRAVERGHVRRVDLSGTRRATPRSLKVLAGGA